MDIAELGLLSVASETRPFLFGVSFFFLGVSKRFQLACIHRLHVDTAATDLCRLTFMVRLLSRPQPSAFLLSRQATNTSYGLRSSQTTAFCNCRALSVILAEDRPEYTSD